MNEIYRSSIICRKRFFLRPLSLTLELKQNDNRKIFLIVTFAMDCHSRSSLAMTINCTLLIFNSTLKILSSPNFISYSSSFDSLFDEFFVVVLLRFSSFDLEKNDLVDISLWQSVEDDIVYSLPDEGHISGSVIESWEERSEFFVIKTFVYWLGLRDGLGARTTNMGLKICFCK